MTTALAVSVLSLAVPRTRAGPPEAPASPTPVKASDIEWKGVLGQRSGGEHQAYVLVAREFLSIPFLSGNPNQCEDLETVVASWLSEHPTATATPVYRIPLDEEYSFAFVWITDGPKDAERRPLVGNREGGRDHR
jgi:hypothetical protein